MKHNMSVNYFYLFICNKIIIFICLALLFIIIILATPRVYTANGTLVPQPRIKPGPSAVRVLES